MTPTTTPTINGLRLVSPEEAGKKSIDEWGNSVTAVITNKDGPQYYVLLDKMGGININNAVALVDLPKPRTTRPHKRGEVKLGDTFRHKAKGWDKMVVFVGDEAIDLGWDNISYQTLLENWQKLTYDSDGREVLSEAGQVEE